MATTASDTGNQFADAWNNNQWSAARQATDPKAVAPDGRNATVDAYRAAWAKENMGQYGDINVAPASSLLPVAEAPAAQGSKFRQQLGPLSGMNMAGIKAMGGDIYGNGGYGNWNYGDAIPAAGTPEFADFQAYWNNGGVDPNDKYGRAAETAKYAQAWWDGNPSESLWNPYGGPTAGWNLPMTSNNGGDRP